MGGRQSSVVLSVPTANYPAAPGLNHKDTTKLVSICIIEIVTRKGRKSTKIGWDRPIFKNSAYYRSLDPDCG